MNKKNFFPECNAPLENVTECRDYLNEMIKWDFEDFNGVGQVHHLTVLSYNLQHPSLYSKKGLENAKKSLEEFIQNPTAYTKHGAVDLKNLASDVRDWKVTGSPEDHGSYNNKIFWEINAHDVVKGGIKNYIENVKKWSESVLKSINL